MNAIKLNGLLALAIILALVAAPSASGVEPPFLGECRGLVSVDYSVPLRGLAPIRRPPPNEEQLPFAPHGITLRVPMPRVLDGEAEIGLALAQRGESSPRLNWTVVSSLSRVGKGGAVAKLLRSKRQHVDRVDFLHPQRARFAFSVPGRPSIYEVSSTFFDASGRRLGSYGEYFRVLEHRAEYRQSVSPRMAHGGDLLISRTESAGTTGLLLGNDFAIDRFVEGEWKLDPISPRGFVGVGYSIGAGITLECRTIRLPLDTPPGHYRFRKEVEVVFHKPHTIAADFFVLP